MNYYEQFRNDVFTDLLGYFSHDDTNTILSIIDRVAQPYTLDKAPTDLTVVSDGIPQILKIHLASLAIEERSPYTIRNRMLHLNKFFNAIRKPFNTVTSNDIRAYLYNYQHQRGVSSSTLDNIRIEINSFFNWCVREEYITSNPAAKIGVIKHQPAERPHMSALELETFRQSCITIREKAIVDFLYSTGCRCSELCAVKLSDVDITAQTVVIRHGKGNKRRITYLNAESVISLQAYLASRDDDCPYLFVSLRRPTHGLKKDAIEDVIRQIRKRATIKTNVTPHVFRHTSATIALNSGMPVEHVQKFLGHSKLDTTMIYARTDDSAVQASHKKYLA